jgi:hydroxymethylpyrimidine pyrophosphatase-like HAD family hydrolase
VCERLGLDQARTIAIGDGENDRELLRAAGFGVAVAGGFAGLVDDADWVCPPLAEDGAARTLSALAAARR